MSSPGSGAVIRFNEGIFRRRCERDNRRRNEANSATTRRVVVMLMRRV